MSHDEPFTTQRGTSTRGSSPSTSQPRTTAAYATERAEVLFGCYRRGDANDPDRYVTAIAAVLATYDSELVREVTDPRTGISTTEKFASFMPNSGELKIYCEAQAARRDRLRHLGSLPKPAAGRALLERPEPQPGDLANVFVGCNHPKYDRICKWAETADKRLWRYVAGGIVVGYNALDEIGGMGRSTTMADHARELAESIRMQRAQATEAAE